MRAFRFVTVDVFTDTRFGGNQLAVFPDARGLTDAEMQSLAAEFNLSETTFVLPPAHPQNSARVRIFNRVAEMAFAGHPNVGTAWVLGREDEAAPRAYRFEEPAGLVEVVLDRDQAGRVVGAEVAAPQPLKLGATLPAATAAACAGIAEDAIVTARHAPVLAADGGNHRLLTEVTPEALAAATPDLAAFRRAVAEHPEATRGFLSLYIYCRDGAAVRARMFSPLTGTVEDAATGSAATPLAGFLLHLDGAEEGAWDITQGAQMGRPSLLRARARRTEDGIRARVGGGCVAVLRGEAVL
ncbi:PhzF family phenazine biosynthesis protein [Roseomonas sp. CECT 9278]|uniref:PhzF family phenazine biosynthesis protein n=1 Tax=Roseomonas sp. CECT 9278 TaxID=2845823 RepID=UPI001E59AE7B|nr:PhzF family phenazine biosynthesis protein [Roseomonas sp. CECT 9278]CAH0189270.1 Trans-2,3-dihydro-3-hydroxyanthranilate isomerase [Roseomonas sp. CECT 9278]